MERRSLRPRKTAHLGATLTPLPIVAGANLIDMTAYPKPKPEDMEREPYTEARKARRRVLRGVEARRRQVYVRIMRKRLTHTHDTDA